jgi:hypothetical protein
MTHAPLATFSNARQGIVFNGSTAKMILILNRVETIVKHSMLAKMDFALLWLRSWTQTTVESASA